MKKHFILTGIIALSLTLPVFATENDTVYEKTGQPAFEHKKPDMPPHFKDEKFKQKQAEFEKKLKLTDEQKAKSETIRENGRKQIEPYMKAMKTKKDEFNLLKNSQNTTVGELNKVKDDMKELHKKIHEIRINNMKEFEKILTEKQLKELDKIKEDGRKQFEKNRKNSGFNGRPPMSPDFDKDKLPE